MLDILVFAIVCIVSVILLTKGAVYLVEGSADFARFLKINPMIIGLVIVGFGTSMPELIVSLVSAVTGNTDLLLGNVVGSNIVNIGLILGLSALIYPLAIRTKTLMHEMAFMITAAFLFLILGNDWYLFRTNVYSFTLVDGVIFLVGFSIFIYYIVRSAQHQRKAIVHEFSEEYTHTHPLWKNILLMVGGILMLFIGGRLFIYGATALTTLLGISQTFIGLTLVALGTSLPELFTTIVAAMKKETDIVVGNIIGSNIFNIFLVLGVTTLVTEITINPMILFVDALIMVFFTLLFMVFATTYREINRVEGGILVLLYIIYMIYLFTSVRV
ncbi:calcium/sodium antiporter [Candidatus Woesearchaeota archaeon]|nr:calcium/sodium antiporter [Candidatus Woesearchaeota archaeon]